MFGFDLLGLLRTLQHHRVEARISDIGDEFPSLCAELVELRLERPSAFKVSSTLARSSTVEVAESDELVFPLGQLRRSSRLSSLGAGPIVWYSGHSSHDSCPLFDDTKTGAVYGAGSTAVTRAWPGRHEAYAPCGLLSL